MKLLNTTFTPQSISIIQRERVANLIHHISTFIKRNQVKPMANHKINNTLYHLAKIQNFQTIPSLTHFIKHLMCIPKSMISLILSPTIFFPIFQIMCLSYPYTHSDQNKKGQIKFHIHQWNQHPSKSSTSHKIQTNHTRIAIFITINLI